MSLCFLTLAGQNGESHSTRSGEPVSPRSWLENLENGSRRDDQSSKTSLDDYIDANVEAECAELDRNESQIRTDQ
jgi:hypothetical protein